MSASFLDMRSRPVGCDESERVDAAALASGAWCTNEALPTKERRGTDADDHGTTPVHSGAAAQQYDQPLQVDRVSSVDPY